MTLTNKEKLKQYLMCYAWLRLHAGDENMKDQIVKVDKRAGELEKEVLEFTARDALDKSLKEVEKWLETPFHDMKTERQAMYVKLVFGQESAKNIDEQYMDIKKWKESLKDSKKPV